MKAPLCSLLLATIMMLGCGTLRFYPVQGPLVSLKPVPVLKAKFSGLNSGNVSVVLNDGEVCKGKWTTVNMGTKGANAGGTPVETGDMSSVWDSVYGQDFYNAHVLGKFIHESIARGERGTTVDIQLYVLNNHENDINGVAKDSNGNVYKVVY